MKETRLRRLVGRIGGNPPARKKEAPATLGRSQFGDGGLALRAAAEGMP